MIRDFDKIGGKTLEFKSLITQFLVRFPVAGVLALLNIIISIDTVYVVFGENKIAIAGLFASIMSIGLLVMLGLFHKPQKIKRKVAYGQQGFLYVFFILAACAFCHWIDYKEAFLYQYFLTLGAIVSLLFFALSSSRENSREAVPMVAFSIYLVLTTIVLQTAFYINKSQMLG